MSDLDAALKRQPRLNRYLGHIFQRLEQKRLNLVTGAGISIPAGVPSWYGLLDRLAEVSKDLQKDFARHRQLGLHPEYLGQILYHRRRSALDPSIAVDIREATAGHEWATAIHEAIYRDVPPSISDVVAKHPFLGSLRDLARKVPLVINFNFDDLLSDAMGEDLAVGQGAHGRPFTVVWQPPIVDRPDTTTIYHVNGVLPRISLRKRSPQLIFTEDSFAAAMARSPGISAEYTLLRFVQNTMLIIGHSLNDNSLKNYLRRNRDKSPANHHYMIYWIEKDGDLTKRQQQDIFEANLELYNVVTIFLTSKEIGTFLRMLNSECRDFRDFLDEFGPDRRNRYHYYIAGPVASGKSSVLEHLRCFNTFEEWTRPAPKEMYYAHDKLDADAQKKVDAFIYAELKEKNLRMDATLVGFHFMDRAPLDLYAFSKGDADENKRKTAELKEHVTRDKGLQPGEIVYITARPDSLVKRNLGRGRPPADSGNEAYFAEQDKQLREVYQPAAVISTDDFPSGEIARQIARHALFDDYSPVDLMAIMGRYA